MKKNRDLDFLFEIGCIRFISRFWKRFLNADFQNLAEHHFRVSWIALILAKREGITNYEKLLKMSLVHDIAESRTGDTDYLSRQYVEQFRELAIKDILCDTSLEKELLSLVKEYEKRASKEAKIVKDADSLDIDFELKEQEARGNILRKEWLDQRKFLSENKFYTISAKELWDELQSSNPHTWHTQGRNRFSKSGDLTVTPTSTVATKAFVISTTLLQKKGFIPKKRQSEILYHKLNEDDLTNLYNLAKKSGKYTERFGPAGVEGDPSFQQLIMYGYFLNSDNKILMYKRVSGTEKRLLNQSSIGIGGHIDVSDIDLTSALYNELDEEVQILKGAKVLNFRKNTGDLDIKKLNEFLTITPKALIKDNVNVGKDHLGIVCVIKSLSKDISLKLRSKDIQTTAQYISKDKYQKLIDSGRINPEIWTHIVVKNEL